MDRVRAGIHIHTESHTYTHTESHIHTVTHIHILSHMTDTHTYKSQNFVQAYLKLRAIPLLQ